MPTNNFILEDKNEKEHKVQLALRITELAIMKEFNLKDLIVAIEIIKDQIRYLLTNQNDFELIDKELQRLIRSNLYELMKE